MWRCVKINQTKLDTQPPADLLPYRWAGRRAGGCLGLTAATGSGRTMADKPTRCDPDPPARAGCAPQSNGRHALSQSPAGDDLRGVTERAIEQIQELLASSEVRAGGRLPPQRRLASMLGISRPTLRLALKALSVMGAVEAAPRRGTLHRRGAAARVAASDDAQPPGGRRRTHRGAAGDRGRAGGPRRGARRARATWK